MEMNQSKFGGLIGCSQQNVGKMIKKGILTLNENKKLNKDESLQALRDFGLLDENDKLIKSRSAKDDKKETKTQTAALPFEGDVPYDAYAHYSDEEIEQLQKEKEDKLRQINPEIIEFGNTDGKTDKSNDDVMKFADAKAHREHYMGKIAEMDYLIKTGEYIPKEDVEKTFFEVSRLVRDQLLTLPNKMSLRVVGKSDAKVIEGLLMAEIQDILGNLSK